MGDGVSEMSEMSVLHTEVKEVATCKVFPLKLQRQAMERRSAEACRGERHSPIHQRGSHFTVFCISPLYWLCENKYHGAIHASRCRSSNPEPNTSLLLTKRSSGPLSLAPMRMRNHETLVDITR